MPEIQIIFEFSIRFNTQSIISSLQIQFIFGTDSFPPFISYRPFGQHNLRVAPSAVYVIAFKKEYVSRKLSVPENTHIHHANAFGNSAFPKERRFRFLGIQMVPSATA